MSKENEITMAIKDGPDGKLVEIYVPPRLLTAREAMLLAGQISHLAVEASSD